MSEEPIIIGGWTEDEKKLDEDLELSIDHLNKLIISSTDSYMIRKLSDRNLLPIYKESKSVKK